MFSHGHVSQKRIFSTWEWASCDKLNRIIYPFPTPVWPGSGSTGQCMHLSAPMGPPTDDVVTGSRYITSSQHSSTPTSKVGYCKLQQLICYILPQKAGRVALISSFLIFKADAHIGCSMWHIGAQILPLLRFDWMSALDGAHPSQQFHCLAKLITIHINIS